MDAGGLGWGAKGCGPVGTVSVLAWWCEEQDVFAKYLGRCFHRVNYTERKLYLISKHVNKKDPGGLNETVSVRARQAAPRPAGDPKERFSSIQKKEDFLVFYLMWKDPSSSSALACIHFATLDTWLKLSANGNTMVSS